MTAEEIIAALDLKPHPEGGHFKETFRDSSDREGRAHSTAIYYLLKRDERSHWHRIDAAEIWHYYAGDPLELEIAIEGRAIERCTLGANVLDNQSPQITVPSGAWQRAQSHGDWTLVGCTVAPGFEFDTFEIAPAEWEPKTKLR